MSLYMFFCRWCSLWGSAVCKTTEEQSHHLRRAPGTEHRREPGFSSRHTAWQKRWERPKNTETFSFFSIVNKDTRKLSFRVIMKEQRDFLMSQFCEGQRFHFAARTSLNLNSKSPLVKKLIKKEAKPGNIKHKK